MNRWILPLVAMAGGVVGAGSMWAVNRAGGGDVGREVRAYLLDHPEIIPEAMQRLQTRESGKAIAALRPAIETPFAGAWAGNPKGDITVVQYFDYNCGYCRASLPTIGKLIAADPNIRVVFRELPILSDESRVAARASLAAAEQNRFKPFHDALYGLGPVSEETIRTAAAKTGVKIDGLDDKALDAEIARNYAVAAKLNLSGTPAWVIGDRVLSGALPIEDLQKAIAEARAG